MDCNLGLQYRTDYRPVRLADGGAAAAAVGGDGHHALVGVLRPASGGRAVGRAGVMGRLSPTP